MEIFLEKSVAICLIFCNFANSKVNILYNVIYKGYYFMADNKKIKTALISVFHKDGLEELLKKLNDEGVKFLSTGGTRTALRSC